MHAIGHGYLESRFDDLEQSTEHIYTSFTYSYGYLDTFCDVTNLHIHQINGEKIHNHGWKLVPKWFKALPPFSDILTLCKNDLFAILSNLFGHKTGY